MVTRPGVQVSAAGVAAVCLLAGTHASAGQARAPVAVHLEPIGDDVVQGFAREKVEAVLRQRLARKKGIVLVPNAEEASLVLRVTECVGWGETHRIRESTERPVAIPTEGGGMARGGERAYGVRTEHRKQVVLIVRATWPERFMDLQASDDDRTLKAAADSVAGALDALAKRGLRLR